MRTAHSGGTRIGLVLGGGGYRGGAWVVGVLGALQQEFGWELGDASLVVGTSAGAMIGALAASRVELARIASGAAFTRAEGFHDAGENMDGARASRRFHDSMFWPVPGS